MGQQQPFNKLAESSSPHCEDDGSDEAAGLMGPRDFLFQTANATHDATVQLGRNIVIAIQSKRYDAAFIRESKNFGGVGLWRRACTVSGDPAWHTRSELGADLDAGRSRDY
jgi:hypothetical protein